MRTTADHAGDRPEDWEAPGAALVRSAATDRIPALADLGRVHIMGIAGSGMSALARILFDRGVPVSGCEARESITVARAASARRRRRHRPLPAAPRRHRHVRLHDRHQPRHQELVATRESGKLVLRRAAALEDRRCVAVAGTHGRPRRPRCWWSRCRRAAWSRPSPTESSSNDPTNQQPVTLAPHDTLIHRP